MECRQRYVSLTPPPRLRMRSPLRTGELMSNYQFLYQRREEERDLVSPGKAHRSRKPVYEIALLRRHAEALSQLSDKKERCKSGAPAVVKETKRSASPTSKPVVALHERALDREQHALLLSLRELDTLLSKVRGKSKHSWKLSTALKSTSTTKRYNRKL